MVTMETAEFRVALFLLLMAAMNAAEQGQNTTSKTMSETTTNLSVPTTEEERVTFPPGDVLNDPVFKKIKFIFPKNETVLEGIRNALPYFKWVFFFDDEPRYVAVGILKKAGEIAGDPVLRSKFYCSIQGEPDTGYWDIDCVPGNHPFFRELWIRFPLGMLSYNIPLSVLNATLAFLSLLFGIFGNILIVISILTKKKLRTSTNLILTGIAVVDCLNSGMVLSYGYIDTFLWSITNPALGFIGCGIMKSLKEWSQLVAINHLITLSFERYFAICWPMKTSLRFTQKKIIPILIINWIIGAIQIIPFILSEISLDGIIYEEYECEKQSLSVIPHNLRAIYTLSVYLLLPVPILCFNCISIVRTLLTSIKRSRQMTGETSRQTNTEKARLKLAYMLIALVVIYVITVTPGRIFTTLDLVEIVRADWVKEKIYHGFLDMLRAMNSCTNVIVYSIISRQFRAAFKEILCSCCRKNSAATSGPGNHSNIEVAPGVTAATSGPGNRSSIEVAPARTAATSGPGNRSSIEVAPAGTAATSGPGKRSSIEVAPAGTAVNPTRKY